MLTLSRNVGTGMDASNIILPARSPESHRAWVLVGTIVAQGRECPTCRKFILEAEPQGPFQGAHDCVARLAEPAPVFPEPEVRQFVEQVRDFQIGTAISGTSKLNSYGHSSRKQPREARTRTRRFIWRQCRYFEDFGCVLGGGVGGFPRGSRPKLFSSGMRVSALTPCESSVMLSPLPSLRVQNSNSDDFGGIRQENAARRSVSPTVIVDPRGMARRVRASAAIRVACSPASHSTPSLSVTINQLPGSRLKVSFQRLCSQNGV